MQVVMDSTGSPLLGSGPRTPGPSTPARACNFCRVRKIKCDRTLPTCSSCITHSRQCIYTQEKRRPRVPQSVISEMQKEKDAMASILLRLKTTPPENAASVLQEVSVLGGMVKVSTPGPLESSNAFTAPAIPYQQEDEAIIARYNSSPQNETPNSAYNPSNHVSIDDHGQVGVFGLTSTHHETDRRSLRVQNNAKYQESRDQLVACAALQRHKEFQIRLLPDIDGVPVEMAMHLLEVHWNRPHHTFLLTYRPVVMRDIVQSGSYASKLLLNAIFASSSKYSDRVSLRDDPSDPSTSGGRFFRRFEELIATEPPFGRPNIPTIIAFLLVGSSLVARGEISKGWSYSGFAFRMVYDMGLHIDCHKPKEKPEEIEIRRRVFWGAFINDKMQSLYLGRPVAMHIEDSHCPDEFMDIYEEFEPWTPYFDPMAGPPTPNPIHYEPSPVYSVSTFQQLCRLAKLMARIMKAFYSSDIDVSCAQYNLHSLDSSLSEWYAGLPPHLAFAPWSSESRGFLPPNIMNLHNTYHSLVILLNRPFVSDGHLRSLEENGDVAATCWKKCTVAARNITSILATYRSACTLRGAPYLTGYAAYVSCTIHVRNAALEQEGGDDKHLILLLTSLRALDELSTPNPGAARPAVIIRRLMQKYGIVVPSDPSLVPDMNFSYESGIGPQSPSLEPLFDTFAFEGQHMDQFLNANGSSFEELVSTNDSLFGFMNFTGAQQYLLSSQNDASLVPR